MKEVALHWFPRSEVCGMFEGALCRKRDSTVYHERRNHTRNLVSGVFTKKCEKTCNYAKTHIFVLFAKQSNKT